MRHGPTTLPPVHPGQSDTAAGDRRRHLVRRRSCDEGMIVPLVCLPFLKVPGITAPRSSPAAPTAPLPARRRKVLPSTPPLQAVQPGTLPKRRLSPGVFGSVFPLFPFDHDVGFQYLDRCPNGWTCVHFRDSFLFDFAQRLAQTQWSRGRRCIRK